MLVRLMDQGPSQWREHHTGWLLKLFFRLVIACKYLYVHLISVFILSLKLQYYLILIHMVLLFSAMNLDCKFSCINLHLWLFWNVKIDRNRNTEVVCCVVSLKVHLFCHVLDDTTATTCHLEPWVDCLLLLQAASSSFL